MDSLVRQLKEQLDIVEIAKEFPGLHLECSGSVYKGLCPHGDVHTKSLVVYPETQSFYCYGCSAGTRAVTGGSTVIHLYAFLAGLSFEDAVETLARRVGLQLTLTDEQIALREQATAYHARLLQSPDYLRYLASRGIDQAMIKRWLLGLDDQGHLVYPVADESRVIIGFAYRQDPLHPDAADPKYRNSTFKKGALLYGWSSAKALAAKTGCIVLVEGYNDAILGLKYGVPTAALMGITLTKEHVALLQQVTKRVILFLDNDQAGQAEAPRMADVLCQAGFVVEVFFSDSVDPDEFFLANREHSLDLIRQGAYDVILSRITSCLADYQLESTKLLRTTLEKVLDLIYIPKSRPDRLAYITAVEKALGISLTVR